MRLLRAMHDALAAASAGEEGEGDCTLPHRDYDDAARWVAEQLQKRAHHRGASR